MVVKIMIAERAISLIIVLIALSSSVNGQTPISADNDKLKVLVELIPTNQFNNVYDVNKCIPYNIQLTNNISSSMHYTVEFEVGSDISDKSISQKKVYEINVPANGNNSLYKQVFFKSQELDKGQFAEWSRDDYNNAIWKRAWYCVRVDPVIGENVTINSPTGEPPLMHVPEAIYKGSVSPDMGTNETLYDYMLEMISPFNETIILQVGPTKTGPWTDCGSRNYSKPLTSQVFNWNNVSLNFDFEEYAYYHFVGNDGLPVFLNNKNQYEAEGPFWPIYYNYTNVDVEPDFGFSNTPFNYSIEFNATKNLDIALFVRDLDLNEYRLVKKVPYRCSPLTTRLNWMGINPIERTDSNVKGKSSYYFGFYYPESEAEINTTRKELGRPYSGPSITLITFENLSVVPDIGNYLSTYTYYVDAKTALPECDIELQTLNPNSSIWRSQGVSHYNGDSETCCWNDVKLEGYGSASYRIVCDDTVLVENGPEILPTNLVGHVNPRKGSLDCTYSYEVDIETIGEHKAILIELEAFDPVNEDWFSFGTQWYDKSLNTDTLKFVVGQLPFSSCLGNLKYRLVSEEHVLGEFIGPEIYVDFKNERYKIEDNGTYTYSVDVWSNDNLSIDLVYSQDGIIWFQADDLKIYNNSSSENWQKMDWNNHPMYRMFKFREIR